MMLWSTKISSGIPRAAVVDSLTGQIFRPACSSRLVGVAPVASEACGVDDMMGRAVSSPPFNAVDSRARGACGFTVCLGNS